MASAKSLTTGGCWPWAVHSGPPDGDVMVGLQLFSSTLQWPFDAMRSQYAQAVQAGLLANSILASSDFDQAVAALEHTTLGPFARCV